MFVATYCRQTINSKLVTGAYTAGSTDFAGDGQCWIERDANLTGIADGRIVLFSVWVRPSAAGAGTLDFIYNDNSDGLQIFLSSGDLFVVQGATAASTTVIDVRSSVAITRNGTAWTHCLLSFDMNTAGRRQLYINGVDRTTEVTFTSGNDIDLANNDSTIGAATGAVPFIGCMSELYFTTPAAYYDISSGGNLAAFISGGVPVNLGDNGSTPTGTQPLVYLKNEGTSFITNSGSGGNFVKKGTTALAVGSTHP